MSTKKYAHITDGVIADTILADDAFVAAHPLDWVECPDEFGIGDLHDSPAGFCKPTPPDRPAGPRLLTKVAYLKRFTQAERIGIREAAKVNAVVEDYVELLNLAQDVDLADPETIAGVQQLEAAGLLVTGRAAEILT